jgi:hypothetical protein
MLSVSGSCPSSRTAPRTALNRQAPSPRRTSHVSRSTSNGRSARLEAAPISNPYRVDTIGSPVPAQGTVASTSTLNDSAGTGARLRISGRPPSPVTAS